MLDSYAVHTYAAGTIRCNIILNRLKRNMTHVKYDKPSHVNCMCVQMCGGEMFHLFNDKQLECFAFECGTTISLFVIITIQCKVNCDNHSTVIRNKFDKSWRKFRNINYIECKIICRLFDYCNNLCFIDSKMLTQYIGNITRVEPGQIIVVVGKTTDAATR